ncbi:root phototropism protein 3-like [Cryptomeria japonica]|uniref:root phototropism protein 3-like n=1 Tax=Cryptomeria japonica TaxID=3369 RepID=UPI0027DA8242|nr:root phototropism protein 3-like [Cryptomeria japonica]XP_057851483.2 root phototropism protein 3-like [Cryptomeria japonica]
MIVEVDDVLFHLHKFPLLSKSGRLNKLVFGARDTENEYIKLEEFPGGAKSFELAAKFCYGTIPLHMSASNVAALRCAAEYLEMSEDLGQGNLISRTEEFLSYVVSVSWLDSITVLRSCAHLSPWAEDLYIVQRCVESIAWKASTDPTLITWSFTTSSSAHHQYTPPTPLKCKLDLQGQVTNSKTIQSAEEIYVNESTDSTENGQAKIEKLNEELSNLKRFCESIEQKLGNIWRPSVWRFPWNKRKTSFSARSNNVTPLPSPPPKEGRTWNPMKWRTNSL